MSKYDRIVLISVSLKTTFQSRFLVVSATCIGGQDNQKTKTKTK